MGKISLDQMKYMYSQIDFTQIKMKIGNVGVLRTIKKGSVFTARAGEIMVIIDGYGVICGDRLLEYPLCDTSKYFPLGLLEHHNAGVNYIYTAETDIIARKMTYNEFEEFMFRTRECSILFSKIMCDMFNKILYMSNIQNRIISDRTQSRSR